MPEAVVLLDKAIREDTVAILVVVEEAAGQDLLEPMLVLVE
jgi:hypothetical protein